MLYFVATPIGNLKDITFRAVEVLKGVDVIACEDTRNSSVLLNHYNIHKKLIAYHKHNEETSSNGIIKLLEEGKEVAVISDGGMPVISDPGNKLIKKLIANNLPYTIIPGASAGLSALVLSGFNAEHFSFVGFLPEKNKQRSNILQQFKTYRTTLIFYISPHNIEKDLKEIYAVFGKRKACLVKEITKIYETIEFFELGETPKTEIKGEFVLIVEGTTDDPLLKMTKKEQLNYFLEQGLNEKEALKQVAKLNNIKNKYELKEELSN